MLSHTGSLGMLHVTCLILKGNPTLHIYHFLNGNFTNKKGNLEAQVTEALDMDLDERNIVGIYNTMRLV